MDLGLLTFFKPGELCPPSRYSGNKSKYQWGPNVDLSCQWMGPSQSLDTDAEMSRCLVVDYRCLMSRTYVVRHQELVTTRIFSTSLTIGKAKKK
jgi:hypothetical protein